MRWITCEPAKAIKDDFHKADAIVYVAAPMIGRRVFSQRGNSSFHDRAAESVTSAPIASLFASSELSSRARCSTSQR